MKALSQLILLLGACALQAESVLGEHDTTLWRVLLAHVRKAYAALDLSELVHLGVDEMNCRKGHHYLTVFADLIARRVVFATDGKDHTTFQRFSEEILKHNGHPKAITRAAIDLSAAYQKGVREELANAQVVFDPFHVSALVSAAVDEVRRAEARHGENEVKTALKHTLYLFRKNPENLTDAEQERLDELDLKQPLVAPSCAESTASRRARRVRSWPHSPQPSHEARAAVHASEES